MSTMAGPISCWASYNDVNYYQYMDPAATIETTYGFYVRDHWQITRKLTFSYGIRYEIYPFSHGEYGIEESATILRPTSSICGSMWLRTTVYSTPRIGIAYRMNEKTVMRTGYGIDTNCESFRYIVRDLPGGHFGELHRSEHLFGGGQPGDWFAGTGWSGSDSGTLPLPPNYATWLYPRLSIGATWNRSRHFPTRPRQGHRPPGGYVGSHASVRWTK